MRGKLLLCITQLHTAGVYREREKATLLQAADAAAVGDAEVGAAAAADDDDEALADTQAAPAAADVRATAAGGDGTQGGAAEAGVAAVEKAEQARGGAEAVAEIDADEVAEADAGGDTTTIVIPIAEAALEVAETAGAAVREQQQGEVADATDVGAAAAGPGLGVAKEVGAVVDHQEAVKVEGGAAEVAADGQVEVAAGVISGGAAVATKAGIDDRGAATEHITAAGAGRRRPQGERDAAAIIVPQYGQ